MGELWRARRWQQILRLIDQLPRASRYNEAVSNDPEHVEMIIEARRKSNAPVQKGPRVSEYTAVVERLDTLIDAINSNTATTIAAAGTRPPKVHLQPRPQTAYAEIEYRTNLKALERLTARIKRKRAQKPED